MALQYDIVHTTTYRYNEPVRFGEHRVMFRPRDSHDQRVLATDLKVSPAADIRLFQDPHSNSIALVRPRDEADALSIVCSFTIEHVHGEALEHPLSPSAKHLPVAYDVQERLDLEHYLRPHHDDPDGRLADWARGFLLSEGPTGTREMLVRMNQHIRDQFKYAARDEEGTQTPVQTIELGQGTCRDFALLMMEAVRRLGLAARFVSGYLYDPALDDNPGLEPGAQVTGAGVTHAWLQVYLPGAGWVGFDPTNNLFGGSRLFRVAVTRDPAHAAPVSGSWFGPAGAYAGMDVGVTVTLRRT
jgi:transglutaminase-like putative cysteine protease